MNSKFDEDSTFTLGLNGLGIRATHDFVILKSDVLIRRLKLLSELSLRNNNGRTLILVDSQLSSWTADNDNCYFARG